MNELDHLLATPAVAALVQAYADGDCSLPELKQQLGMGQIAVQRLLAAAGVPLDRDVTVDWGQPEQMKQDAAA